MRIAVIDGQGGGIGKAIIERIKPVVGEKGYIIALGTNALATAQMLKAGADDGATGENAIIVNVKRADVILGPVGILAANSMLGELTPTMAEAIGASGAEKFLIPLNRCKLNIAGIPAEPLAYFVDELCRAVKAYMQKA